MCLFPRILYNKKYQPNKKNKGIVPELRDPQFLRVQARCGRCIQCRKQIAREWQQRLAEELKTSRGYFTTLTFTEDDLERLTQEVKGEEEYIERYGIENAVAKRAIELWRKRTWKMGLKERHWLITELGHEGTERVHIHGIVFSEATGNEIIESWPFGYADCGRYCNDQSIGYIVKYVHKADHDHPDFIGKIFASKGLGRQWLEGYDAKKRHYEPDGKTKEFYRLSNGRKVSLAGYYRNHLYNSEEKEKLWKEKLEKKYRFVDGVRYETRNQEELLNFYSAIVQRQRDNRAIGYPVRKWDLLVFEKTMGQMKAIKNIDEEKWPEICELTKNGIYLLT